MEPKIVNIESKKLVGKHMKMSLKDNKTHILWKDFMSNKADILNTISNNYYSLQVYEPDYFKKFSMDKEFIKWALIEVANFSHIPEGFESFELPAGDYAVFIHKGDVAAFQKTFQYIFQTWLPNSDYTLDNRPHFELLGEKYRNNSAESEEEVWIPIKKK